MIKIAPLPLTRPQYLRRLITSLSYGLSGPTFSNSPTHAPVVDFLTTGHAKGTDELVLLGSNKNSNNVWVLHSCIVRKTKDENGEEDDNVIADLNCEYTPTIKDGRYRYFNGRTYCWLKELVRYPLAELAEEHEVPIVLAVEEN